MSLPLSTSRKWIFLVSIAAIYSFALVGCKKSAPTKPPYPTEKIEKAQKDEIPMDEDSSKNEEDNSKDSSLGVDNASDGSLENGEKHEEEGIADVAEESGEAEQPEAQEKEKKLGEKIGEDSEENKEKQEVTVEKDLSEGTLEGAGENAEKPAEKEKKIEEKVAPLEKEKYAPPPEPKKKVVKLKPAYLEIVTNFSKASATVNGLAYPSYQPPGTPRGVTLPAGGPYYIVVKYGQNTKSYEVYLRPYERRVIVADLTGFNGVARAPSANRPEPPTREEKRKGKVIVYSQPDALVYFDGKQVADHTPATIEETVGKHEVSVRYNESLRVSEIKPVLLRPNSTVRLYFRQKK